MSGGLPLGDVRVVDLSRFIAGPFCAQILGDMGAEVVKVERPGGEDARHHEPFLEGESLYVMAFSRNKRAMTLDTRHPEALAVLERLIRDSDVLVENYRPGTLAAMGLTPERLRELNPGLIVTSISGFGQDGPLAHRALFDAIAQAMSGLMSLTGDGEQPTMAGTYVADYVAGLYGALGTMMALRHRDRTGEGQVVDVASLDGLFACLATYVMATANLGEQPARTGNRDALNAPANVFKASDGYVYLHGGTNPLFPHLCRAMGAEELAQDERFRGVRERMANHASIERIVAEWVASGTVEEGGRAADGRGRPVGAGRDASRGRRLPADRGARDAALARAPDARGAARPRRADQAERVARRRAHGAAERRAAHRGGPRSARLRRSRDRRTAGRRRGVGGLSPPPREGAASRRGQRCKKFPEVIKKTRDKCKRQRRRKRSTSSWRFPSRSVR